MREVKGKGYLIYLGFHYNLGNPKRKSDQYINMAADIQYNVSRPVFITITLPDDHVRSGSGPYTTESLIKLGH